ncbi:DnaJ-like chaperonin [Gordonia phage Skog]|uniref:DnaJ-like chaperonin n=1 Tax=Gordonia phage Skog TaxID=2704033 RepID=A0A6G6XJT6_9CAUD|nr:DnaJ-like chaperonin [Gordonia phage Skog]QIG58362.1 DnaJ-like chaperonin [Gordonia phage Skog]
MPPWATAKEIRAAVTRLYRKYHPDTGEHPDVDRFRRVHDVAKVLGDSVSRAKYNRTPPGKQLMDAAYMTELINSGIFDGVDVADIEYALNTTPAAAPPLPLVWWDFYTVGHHRADHWLAEAWYRHLLANAYDHGYRSTLKVLMFDGPDPLWDEVLHIVCIPRSWGPTATGAVTLLSSMCG